MNQSGETMTALKRRYDRYLKLATCGGLALLLTACGTLGPQKRSRTLDLKRVRHLEKEVKRQQAVIESLKERNHVLERRNQIGPAAQPSEAAAPVTIPQAPAPSEISDSVSNVPATTSRDDEAMNAAADAPAPTGEQLLYSKVLETYRKRNAAEMKKSVALLLKTYPDSIFADNALYMAGLLALESNDIGSARLYMDRVITEFPKSNKAVSALFAKAAIEKRSKKVSEARRILKQVKDTYPGSPEAARVALETKLLDLGSGKKREM